jgi:dihydrofolate reductase
MDININLKLPAMRKIIVLSFMSLDGVIQAPGGPEEDTTGGFRWGGWSFTYGDDTIEKEMINQMDHDYDLLLGRKTYEIFAGYWPHQETKNNPISASLNKARKYVVTNSPVKLSWENSFAVKGNVVDEIRKLKTTDGPEFQVHGSANMIQTLWKNNLVDELWLKIYPVALGYGKRLFADPEFAGAFELISTRTSPSGVIIANYKRSGDIKTGSYV